MTQKAIYLSLILILLTCLLLLPGQNIPVLSQDQPFPLTSVASFTFAKELSLTVQFASDPQISRAVVFLRSADTAETDVIIAAAQSGNGQAFLAFRDLTLNPIPIFTTMEYWWHVDFVDGSTFTSDIFSFRYYDNRYEWSQFSSSQDGVTLHLYNIDDDPILAQQVFDVGFNSLSSLSQILSQAIPAELSIFLYPSEADIKASLLSGGSRNGGHAEPELNTIILSAPHGTDKYLLIEQIIPHEFAHVMLYHRMGNQYHNLPNWLNEGIASLQEQSPDPAFRLALEHALTNSTTLSITSLCGTFPENPDQSILAYAQSASFVQYLKDIYGTGAISALLDAYKEGTTCQGGVQRVLQRSLSEVESEWLGYLRENSSSTASSLNIEWLLFFSFPLLFLVLYTLALRRRNPFSN